MACTLHDLSKDVTCPETGAMLANQRISGIISDVHFDEDTGETSFVLGGSLLKLTGVVFSRDTFKNGQEVSIDFGKYTTITINRNANES